MFLVEALLNAWGDASVAGTARSACSLITSSTVLNIVRATYEVLLPEALHFMSSNIKCGNRELSRSFRTFAPGNVNTLTRFNSLRNSAHD